MNGEYISGELQRRCYRSQVSTVAGEDWFDLSKGDITLRVILTEEGHAEILGFTGPMVCEWSVRFSTGTPSAVFCAALTAAERDAARGPLTRGQ